MGKVDINTYTPACMAKTGEDYTGKTAWVYGWGALSFGTGDYPDKLQELSVKIVSQAVCQAAHNDLGWTIADGMLCAGGVTGQDSCQVTVADRSLWMLTDNITSLEMSALVMTVLRKADMESMLRLLSTDNGSTPQLLPREELPTVQLPEIEISNDGTNPIFILEYSNKYFISYCF